MSTSNAMPGALRGGDLLGPPPVIAGEDADEFLELLDRVRGAVKPADIIEEIWVRDVVELAWEIRRLRRLKASLLQTGTHEGLNRVLMPLDPIDAFDLSKRWAKRKSVKEAEEVLASAGLTMDAVMAETLSVKLDDIEAIERMIASFEARMAAALREVDRHRAVLAMNAVQEPEDAEFEDVEPKAALPKAAE